MTESNGSQVKMSAAPFGGCSGATANSRIASTQLRPQRQMRHAVKGLPYLTEEEYEKTLDSDISRFLGAIVEKD